MIMNQQQQQQSLSSVSSTADNNNSNMNALPAAASTYHEDNHINHQAAPIVVENLEKEVSILAALPRQVRCCRVVPQQALSMLETLIQRLVQSSADVGSSLSSQLMKRKNSTSGRRGSKSNGNTNNQEDNNQEQQRPAAIVFLERADLWTDLLDEFAETAVQYSSEMPLTADQIRAHAAEQKLRDENGNYLPVSAPSRLDSASSVKNNAPQQTDPTSGIYVEGYYREKPHVSNNNNNNNEDDDGIDNANDTNDKRSHQSIIVNTGHSASGDGHSITSKDLPVGAINKDLSPESHSPTSRNRRDYDIQQQQQRLRSPVPKTSNPNSPLSGGSSPSKRKNNHHNRPRPSSPPRQGEAELYEFLRKSFVNGSNRLMVPTSLISSASSLQQQYLLNNNNAGGDAFHQLQLQQQSPLRRALRLKLLVKEKLRDIFVETAQELGKGIKQPKSVFAPPDVEIASRDFRAMQSEASKFAALVVQLRGELETQLNEDYAKAFETVKKAVDDTSGGGLIGSISERSRKERTHRIVTLVTDVFLTLSILDAQRTEASIDVSRSLLALAGLESRRSCHDNALQLATESAAKLSKLYVREVTTINEFKQATSLNFDNSSLSGYSSLAASVTPFKFLCQLHESIGQGFPAPLEICSDSQKDALSQIINDIQKRLNMIVPLRVAAHFNRASELEHKGGSSTECRAEYTAALTAGTSPRLTDFALHPEHPLMRKTSDALASLVSDSFEKTRNNRFKGANTYMGTTSNNNNNNNSALPPILSARSNAPASASGGLRSAVPQPPVTQRTSRTPLAPSSTFSRVQNANNRLVNRQNANSASRDVTARMFGGSEVAKKLTLAEVEGVKNSNRVPGWADDGGTTAEDDNLKMLKQFGIVPEGTELKKKQRPISSVAHLDDHFIQDVEDIFKDQNNPDAEASSSQAITDPSASQSRFQLGALSDTGRRASSLRRGSQYRFGSTSTHPNHQQQQAQQIEKNLEEKLSSRQIQILSGVHGLMDSKASRTHAEYESELDAIIIRCRRAFVQRDKAARVIQCGWRCAVARLEAHNRRQVYYHYLYQVQKAAGSAILSTYRTHRQEQSFQQKRAEMRNKRQEAAKLELLQRNAVVKITRTIKKFMKQKIYEQELMRKLRIKEREKLVKSDIAAAIIQRWWKIIKYDHRYWQKRNEELRQAQVQDALALQYHAAATRVQRIFRGHQGRFEAKLVKTRVTEQRMKLRRSVNLATDTVRTLLLEYRARGNRLAMMQKMTADKSDVAQRKIRTGWMEALERRKMKLVRARAREVALAARHIQCWWRCHLAKKELRYKRKVAQTITMVRIRKEWSSLRAAWVIQGAWRIYRARRKLRKLKAGVGREKINATWLMQSVGRAYFTRQNLCTERNLLQTMVDIALFKAHRIRDEHVTRVQQYLRPITSQYAARKIHEEKLAEKLVLWKSLRSEQRDDRTAQFFQSVGRGFMLRRDLMPVLQRRARILAQKKFEAARTIQCGWKSSVARDQLRAMKDSKERNRERQLVWGEVQAQLHINRTSQVALNEQTERLSLIKSQKEIRKAIIVAFWYQHQPQEQQNDVQSPSSSQQNEWEKQQSSSSDKKQSNQQEATKQRVLRMYDDSDEEEQEAFVQQILSMKR